MRKAVAAAQAGSASPPSTTGTAPDRTGPQLPARPAKKGAAAVAKKALPPDVQRLADDLMKLMEESGMGGGAAMSGDGDDADDGDMSGLPEMLRVLAGQAAAAAGDSGASASASSSSGGGGAAGAAGGGAEGEAFRSAALRGLAQQTKATVSKQSKFSRGEGKAAGRGQAGGGGGGGGGFGPLGDLLSMAGSMGAGDGGGEGEGGGMGLMVDYIMQNLLSKEVLYGPLRDIRDKYPPWLKANCDGMPPEELERYTAQYAAIQAVCKQYEDDASDFQTLVKLIQQMQTYGDPPSEIVDEMTGGMPGGLMGGPGDTEGNAEDMSNFELTPGFAADLPKELQDKCTVQ